MNARGDRIETLLPELHGSIDVTNRYAWETDWASATRRFSDPLNTHSKATSQPVSSLIHCAGFPATRTGTQNASLHILIGSISQFARFGLHFSSIRTLPPVKSICTIRPRKKSIPKIPSTGWSQQSLSAGRSTAKTDFGRAIPPDAACKSFTRKAKPCPFTPCTICRLPRCTPRLRAVPRSIALIPAPESKRKFSGSLFLVTFTFSQIKPSACTGMNFA